MATIYVGSCDCGYMHRDTTELEARRGLAAHSCHPPPLDSTRGHRCGSCTGVFPLLVDGALCITCDALLYPTPPTFGHERQA